MSSAGCQIIPIDLNFHLQKCLEIFDKNSADKIQSNNYKGGKSALPDKAISILVGNLNSGRSYHIIMYRSFTLGECLFTDFSHCLLENRLYIVSENKITI